MCVTFLAPQCPAAGQTSGRTTVAQTTEVSISMSLLRTQVQRGKVGG